MVEFFAVVCVAFCAYLAIDQIIVKEKKRD